MKNSVLAVIAVLAFSTAASAQSPAAQSDPGAAAEGGPPGAAAPTLRSKKPVANVIGTSTGSTAKTKKMARKGATPTDTSDVTGKPSDTTGK